MKGLVSTIDIRPHGELGQGTIKIVILVYGFLPFLTSEALNQHHTTMLIQV